MDLSIHFPLTREDGDVQLEKHTPFSFNPLPSHEGRHNYLRLAVTETVFQSTSLSRGKTFNTLFIMRPPFTFNPLPSHEGRPN